MLKSHFGRKRMVQPPLTYFGSPLNMNLLPTGLSGTCYLHLLQDKERLRNLRLCRTPTTIEKKEEQQNLTSNFIFMSKYKNIKIININ